MLSLCVKALGEVDGAGQLVAGLLTLLALLAAAALLAVDLSFQGIVDRSSSEDVALFLDRVSVERFGDN